MPDHHTPTPLVDFENRICPGCKKSAVNESGGLVVAFGQSFFHVDCFKCAKCDNQVTADTNLLLLSDGSPICADCSYNCNICQQPILDEAIMTGDDSYHAHCFKCKVCRNRIDELVFAKTSHGIYCMNCHNERMAKIRRHAQRKREKERTAIPSAPPSSRDHDAREPVADNALSDRSLRSKSSAHVLRDAPSTQSLQATLRQVTSPPPRNSRSASPVDPANANRSTVVTPTETQRDSQPQSASLQPSEQPQSFVMTVAPPDTNLGSPELSIAPNGNPRPPDIHDHRGSSSTGLLQSAPANLIGTNSHLSPISAMDGSTSMQRRKSYDDGVRPLNVLLAKSSANLDKDAFIGGLGVPAQTSRADRRRSINPGLSVQVMEPLPNSAPPEMVRSQTLPIRSDSPVGPSPSKAYFDDSIVRRSSNTSLLLRDNASGSTIYHSPASSPAIPENGRTTPEPARARSASHDPQFTSAPRPTTPLRSAPRPVVALERPPKRSHSLRRPNGVDGANGHGTSPPPASTIPPRVDGSKSERSSPLGWNGDRVGTMRPTSPSHRVDVPHGVESGTDTEAESSNGRMSDDVANTDSPPRPPPKPRPQPLKLDVDPDVSAVAQLDGSDESSPVERTSIATFIAPALPPIRFSMSGSDFSDFLKSVGGIPSLKSLNEIAQQEASPRSPTSINTLTPQDDVAKPSTDIAEDPPSNSSPSGATSSADDAGATDTTPDTVHHFPSRDRVASESQASPSLSAPGRERVDSNVSLHITPSASQSSTTRITVTSPAGNPVPPPVTNETHDLVIHRLQEALSDASARGSQQLRFEKVFVETILISLEQRRREYLELKGKYEGSKRASEQYINGLTVAQTEYDRELVARRNAESEIIRLRILLSGQAAKITALTGENSRREARQQLSEELSKNLDRLEKDLSKLKAERDVTLAEVEELCSSKSAPSNVSSGEVSAAQLSRSLTMRLDNVKKQYQHELMPLTQQRETLIREIAELKSAREQFLEETTVLNARNEELAQLGAQYTRRMEVARSDTPLPPEVAVKPEPVLREKKSTSFDRTRPTQELLPPVPPPLSSVSNPSMSTLVDDREIKVIRAPKPDFSDVMPHSRHGIFKWPGYRVRDQTLASFDPRSKGNFEHNFQPASALRFTRCDHCGDKLWGGAHFRCTTCHINIHSRCVNHVHLACSQNPTRPREELNGIAQQPPSIFGRDLAEQVKIDLRWGERKVPVVVEKCIEAVEALALDFEGIYRKTGGLSQTKMITQLFDRGDYTAFDLTDIDRFNDICSVTSVLKTYFRSLPVPLLTHDLHEEFIAAAGLKDSPLKTKQLQELVDRLPPEHYHTLRLLLLHLHRVREHSDTNLMTARNLGVVFGPTLMWSRDPSSEFSDMAGKALMVEWLVENAPTIYQP